MDRFELAAEGEVAPQQAIGPIIQRKGGAMSRVTSGSAALLVASMLACWSVNEGHMPKTHYSRNLIIRPEIAASSAFNAYELINDLRPHWLRGRGARSLRASEAVYPVVYVNRIRRGDIRSLRNISVMDIKEIRFLNAGDATIAYGTGHPSGAIEITI